MLLLNGEGTILKIKNILNFIIIKNFTLSVGLNIIGVDHIINEEEYRVIIR